jgi:hypothetical protein
MAISSGSCVEVRGRLLFRRSPLLVLNGEESARIVVRLEKWPGLEVLDQDGILCSCDGGMNVRTRFGPLHVRRIEQSQKDTDKEWRQLEFQTRLWSWHRFASGAEQVKSRFAPQLRTWGGVRARIFHVLSTRGVTDERYLISERRHSLATQVAVENLGATFCMNFMLIIAAQYWSELEAERWKP